MGARGTLWMGIGIGLVLAGAAGAESAARTGRHGRAIEAVGEVKRGSVQERGGKLKSAPDVKQMPELKKQPAAEKPRGSTAPRKSLGTASRRLGPPGGGSSEGNFYPLPAGVTAEIRGTVAMLSTGETLQCDCAQECQAGVCVVFERSPGLSCEGYCGAWVSIDFSPATCEPTYQCNWYRDGRVPTPPMNPVPPPWLAPGERDEAPNRLERPPGGSPMKRMNAR